MFNDNSLGILIFLIYGGMDELGRGENPVALILEKAFHLDNLNHNSQPLFPLHAHLSHPSPPWTSIPKR